MRRLDFATARSRDWDMIIAGTSFAACFFAYKLRGRGLRVLFCERGPMIERETQIENRHVISPSPVKQTNSSGREKEWIVRHQFGGGSNCWWGNTPRLHPSDFSIQSRYGVGQDWPIGYDELERHYILAEQIMDVAGSVSAGFFPRSGAYPFPAHASTRAEKRLAEHDQLWLPMPTARSNGGRRANCCAAGSCKLCPYDAKFTILNALDMFSDPEFYFTTDCTVREVVTEGGHARGVVVSVQDGEQAEIIADLVALAANPIGNSEILLRSGIGSDAVGRGIHEQLGQFAWLDIAFDNYYGGTSTTGAGYPLYDGDFRSDSASVFIESWNAPPSLRHEKDKWLQRLKLKFIAEDLPQPENRVVLENDEGVIQWSGHSDYAYRGLERARNSIDTLLPFDYAISRIGDFEPTEAHLLGGTPMANDAALGVVNRDCQVFGVDGLYCLGGSTFPSGSAANPTLTIAALSLHASESV